MLFFMLTNGLLCSFEALSYFKSCKEKFVTARYKRFPLIASGMKVLIFEATILAFAGLPIYTSYTSVRCFSTFPPQNTLSVFFPSAIPYSPPTRKKRSPPKDLSFQHPKYDMRDTNKQLPDHQTTVFKNPRRERF